MPPGFELGHPLDLFVPADYEHDPEVARTRGLDAVQAFARLKPGVSPAQAESELQHIGERLAREQPASYAGWGVRLAPLLEARVARVRLILWLVAAAVGVLLSIACANVANLLLARASGRTHEIAVRRALGASRRRIARQLLVEGLLLSFAGALCGVLLARLGLALTLRLAAGRLPRVDGIAIDGRVLGSVALLSLVTGLLFGLAPLLHSSQVGLDRALRQGARGTGDVRVLRVRGLLVVAEIAVAVVLASCSLLLARSFSNLTQVQRGFDPEHALTFDLTLPVAKYANGTLFLDFIDRLRERIGALPGVRAVGAAHALPFAADLNVGRFKVQGEPIQDPAPIFYGLDVTPGYFAAMGVPLLRGRDIELLDARQPARRGLINESFARRFFPGRDPVGQHLAPVQRDEWYEIIGVVGDLRGNDLAGELPNQAYAPAGTPGALTFVVRHTGLVPDLAERLRAAVRELDPEQAVDSLVPLSDWAERVTLRERIALLLSAVFSGTALLLAAVGIYGVMSFSVSERTRELGIRRALGASRAALLAQVLGQAARLTGLGLALGAVGALAVTRVLERLLFGVSPYDPASFALSLLALGSVALGACLAPALRATRIEPMQALKSE